LSGNTKTAGLRAWLELLRVPNLLTVPGDVVAGYFLASLSGSQGTPLQAVFAGICVLLLYAFGLVLNDCVDLARDRRRRPERPLPSGRVPVRTAHRAVYVLGAAGVGCAFGGGAWTGTAALVLLLAIATYNLFSKRRPWAGPAVMGSCRAMSMVVGALAGGWRLEPAYPLGVAVLVLALYVGWITRLARNEAGDPDRIARVGRCIRGLILYQAACTALAWPWGTCAACVLVLLYPLSVRLSRTFHSS